MQVISAAKSERLPTVRPRPAARFAIVESHFAEPPVFYCFDALLC